MLHIAHPAYLSLAFFALVPVVLHLLSMRQLRKLVFPTVRFLRISRQPQEGHRRLRDLLLLLLRALTILLLALFLAEPSWIPEDTSRTHQLGRTRVIILDASASMSSGKRWKEGRHLVEELIKRHSQDLLGLIVSDGREVSGVAPTHDYWRLTEILGSMSPSNYPGNPAVALTKAITWLRDRKSCVLDIVSDFQATDWKHRWNVVPSHIDVQLYDAKEAEEQGNCGITAVHCHRLGTRRLRILVSVESSSPREETRTLTTKAGGKSISATLRIPSMSRLRKVMILDGVSPGQGGEVSLSQDVYEKDDRWLFWDDGEPPMRILLVYDGTEKSESAWECEFVRRALLSHVPGPGRAFEVEAVDVSLLTDDVIVRSDGVLVLGCMAAVQDTEAIAMQRLVEKGGVLIVTPSKNPGSDLARLRSMDMNFGALQGLQGISGGLLSEGVGKVASNSFLYSLFADVDNSDLYVFPIRRCCRLRAGRLTSSLMQGLDGRPLLLELLQDQGRAYFSAFGYSPWWSDFPLTSSFLPLVQEILNHGLAGSTGRRQVICGTLITDAASGLPVDTVEPLAMKDENGILEVNVSRKESEAEYVGKLDLLDLLASGKSMGSTTSNSTEGRDFHRLLGVSLFLVMFLEITLSLWYDRRETIQLSEVER